MHPSSSPTTPRSRPATTSATRTATRTTTRAAVRAAALAPLAAAALLSLAACETAPTLAPDRPLPAMAIAASTLWADVRTGEVGPGALYDIRVPAGWNGDVVYYAHGIRDVLEPISLRDQDGFAAVRDRLGELGFAVATTSFSENGFALKDGAQRVHQLRGIFTSAFGAPRRSFVAGHSLGGAIALSLAERFPSQYDGALPMCGIVGGTARELEYVANVRALFDVFYPGVLPGSATEPPESFVLGPADQLRIVQAIGAAPAGLAVIASTAQTPLEFSYGPAMQQEMVTSLVYALTYHGRAPDNVLAVMHGTWPVDNMETVYSPRALPFPLMSPQQLAGALALVNARVERAESEPAADAYEAHWYEPTGRLEIPVVTLHNRWDPLVPFFHEGILAGTVAAAGAAEMPEQRTIDRYGHCNFTPAEMIDAFTALAAKVPAAE